MGTTNVEARFGRLVVSNIRLRRLQLGLRLRQRQRPETVSEHLHRSTRPTPPTVERKEQSLTDRALQGVVTTADYLGIPQVKGGISVVVENVELAIVHHCGWPKTQSSRVQSGSGSLSESESESQSREKTPYAIRSWEARRFACGHRVCRLGHSATASIWEDSVTRRIDFCAHRRCAS